LHKTGFAEPSAHRTSEVDVGWLVHELEAFLGQGDTREGNIPTGIPSLSVFQSTVGSFCRSVVYKPMLSVIVQGKKRIELGESVYTCGEGRILVVGFDAVLEAEILGNSPDRPFRALCLDLDIVLLQEVASRMAHPPAPVEGRIEGVFLSDRDDALAASLGRLFGLVRSPEAIPVLASAYQREIAYHLLSGPCGGDFVRISAPGSHMRLLAGAVRELQSDLSRPLHVPELAASVGMSPSSFHERFKELTSFSPIQYQKRLRLLEARRLLLTEGIHAGAAAYRVGYQSPSQFSREYRRFFGSPPRSDARGGLARDFHGAPLR
jgi:AraC-like DNA-binding protein